MGLLLAMVDTVTLDRSSAAGVSEAPIRAARCRSPHIEDKPPTNIPLPTRACPTGSRSTPRRSPTRTSTRSRAKAFDANYEGEDDVNRLTAYRFVQNVGYDADGKLVEPIKYASLYKDAGDAQVTARASQWGLPGDPEPDRSR